MGFFDTVKNAAKGAVDKHGGKGETQTTTSEAPFEPGSPKDPGGPGDPVNPPEPQVVPSSTPDGPQTIPSPSTPEGEPGSPHQSLPGEASRAEESQDDTTIETDVQDSNPNSGGPQRLKGDMGISSERAGPFGAQDRADSGLQGTGSHGSAAESTDGQMETHSEGDAVLQRAEERAGGSDADGPDMGESSTGIDRTVGEHNPAQAPSQENDPSKNPGHSHG